MLKWAAIALVAGCASQVDESDLVGSYRVADTCEAGSLVIATDHSIVFNDHPATNVMIDGTRMDQTGTPNLTFIVDYTLYGEGGHVRWMFQLWMDHDGGSGTMNSCSVVLTRSAT